MDIDDIIGEWADDAKIDKAEPGKSAINIALLHQKYHKFLSTERLKMFKLESDLKELKLEKFEFFTDGPTEEQIAKGWRLPPKGRLLKNDAREYVDADPDVISLQLKIAYHREKVDLLESIIKTLMTMNWNIRNYIEWEKFKAGVI